MIRAALLFCLLCLFVHESAAEHWHRRHHPRAFDPDFDSAPRLPRWKRDRAPAAPERGRKSRRSQRLDAPAPAVAERFEPPPGEFETVPTAARFEPPPPEKFELPPAPAPDANQTDAEVAAFVLAEIHAVIDAFLDQLANNLSLPNATSVLPRRHLLQENEAPAPTPPIYSNGEPYPLDENGFYDSTPDDELPTIIMV